MWKKGLESLLIGMVLMALAVGPAQSRAQAQPPPPNRPSIVTMPEDDGGTAEVGVEWITDWPGTADDRANWYYSANTLYNELGSAGWVQKFNWGNTNAWERDFKAAAYGGNGLIDSVDLAMIGTHGSSANDPRYGKVLSSVYFSSNHDDWHLSPGEAYRAYGNNDLEWLAFDSCSVLRDDSMWYWHQAFNGLHLMLGFANTMYVVYPGDGGKWGDQMQKKGWWIFGHGAKTVTQAWFSAVEDQQPSGVRARVLAEELNNYNDYIWGQGYVSPDYPNNGGYWYWDHVAGTPPPLALTTAEPTELPAVQVLHRVVDTNYVQMIGQAFGLTSEVIKSEDGSAFYMVGGADDSLQLKVDALTGGFFFQNLSELWTEPEKSRNLPASTREAAAVVSNFLLKNDYLPGVLNFDPQIPPTIAMEGPVSGLMEGARISATQAMTTTNYAVHYARTVDIGDGTRLSIVGPGARQNVYVGDESQVIGLKGGWRDFQVEKPPAGTGLAPQMIPIKSSTEAWEEFLADPTIVMAQLPAATSYDTIGKPDPTLGYYEQPTILNQNELIPVWIFVADLYVDDADAPGGKVLVTSDAQIYVPASADPLSIPQAEIVSPAPGTVLMPGQTLNLLGAASGGQSPYSFEWSAGIDGILGSGESLTGIHLTADERSSGLQKTTITLQVVDSNGMVSYDSVEVTVMLPLYLPLLARP
jgi:hypothetical protein